MNVADQIVSFEFSSIDFRNKASMAWKAQLEVNAVLTALLALNPQSLGYQRSRWRTEPMAIEVNRIFGFNAHSSTIRRWVPKLGIVWRRACISKIQIKKPNSPESKRH
ncbi:Putative transposase and inactivated derivative [Vibrio vulnificus CMCP6]|uniref:Transposase and inactivated derivative n=1 Tax=Vibrio vulnificus (strain CMCP6) TaxID=216895 RepID=A0A3Q0L739_VIBVU|nr:Putative transposase and inactivated derivative [Vibrio vulnificus CMCP6]